MAPSSGYSGAEISLFWKKIQKNALRCYIFNSADFWHFAKYAMDRSDCSRLYERSVIHCGAFYPTARWLWRVRASPLVFFSRAGRL